MSHHQDGIGYLLAVMKVAVEPDDKEWSERAHAFYKIPEILASQYQHLSTAFKFWLKAATEVMYSKRFTAEAVLQNLGEFLRHYPDILVMVNKTWNGSNQDYSNLEDIIVVLKQEVEKATIRMSTASKYKWGKELTVDDTVEGKGQDDKDKDKDKAKRTEFTDEEREKWKKKNPGDCWNFNQKGSCHFGEKCRFQHTGLSKPKEGQVRYVKNEDTGSEEEELGDQQEESETEEAEDVCTRRNYAASQRKG